MHDACLDVCHRWVTSSRSPRPRDRHFHLLRREGGPSGCSGCQGRLQNMESEVGPGAWPDPPGGRQDHQGVFPVSPPGRGRACCLRSRALPPGGVRGLWSTVRLRLVYGTGKHFHLLTWACAASLHRSSRVDPGSLCRLWDGFLFHVCLN